MSYNMAFIRRVLVGLLVVGMGLCNSALPMALAQVEITPEVREACQQFAPEIRDIAVSEILPAIEAEPEGQEAKRVETTAVAIHETTETTKQALANPEVLAAGTVAALKENGVPANVAATVEAQMKDALTKAREALQTGGSLEDASKYFEVCQRAMADCQGYLGGKDFKEIFAAGGAGFDRPEMGAFAGVVFDPSQRDTFEAAMKAHFETTFNEAALRGGTEGFGPSPEMMRGMMEQMAAAGINPSEVFHGGAGEFMGPSKEVLDAMTPEQRAGYEAWKSGDFTALEAMQTEAAMKMGMEAGMTPEAMAQEITHMQEMATMETMYKEMVVMDPRTESSGSSTTTFETSYSGSARTLTAAHDHNADGTSDEWHYDTNGDGIADMASPVPL